MQACEAPWDSASMIAVEQQFSATVTVQAQLASASLIQAACQTSSSPISTAQLASMFLMVKAQRVFTSLMALVISDSFWQRAIPKSETCFPQGVLIEDLVANKHPRSRLASSLSQVTSKEGAPPLGPGVSTGREGEAWISSRVGSSISRSSGTLT